jgi:hypothetical protein
MEPHRNTEPKYEYGDEEFIYRIAIEQERLLREDNTESDDNFSEISTEGEKK